MKKIVSLFLVAFMLVSMMPTSFGADTSFLADLDADYYGRFKDQGISINVFNWGENMSDGEDDTLDINAAFEELTGIEVVYTTYQSNEEMYSKLKSGGVSYDIIIPSDYMIARMAAEDMLHPIDKANIPNFGNLDVNHLFKDFDPENTYSVPYTWGTVVLIYNTTLVEEGTDVETWEFLWNETYAGNILMFNNPRDAFGIALKKLGMPINPTSTADIDAALAELKTQKPVLQGYVMDEIFDKLQSGEAVVGPYYAGDGIIMMEDNPDLAAVYPREGTNLFIDSMCIPADAQQKEAAEMYINFILEPIVGAANAEYIGYATPNVRAFELLDEEITSNEVVYPPQSVLDNSEAFNLLSDELNVAMDTAWQELLTEDSEFNFWIVPVVLLIAVLLCAFLIFRRIKAKKKVY